MDDHDFQMKAAEAIEDLEAALDPVSEQHGFETEASGGMLILIFEEPAPAKFIVSPNGPARQIWVSALSTSFKFDWDDGSAGFVLEKTREPFRSVIAGLVSRQLHTPINL
jgi:iron donor protein CyaY